MSPARFDAAARDALTACVKEIEKTTAAELVLIVRARSGSYRHADYLFGVILVFVGLVFLLYSPYNFHPNWVLIDVILLFLLGIFLSSRSNAIRRLLTREKFRAGVVRTYAAAMFYEAGIANTKGETGMLVYVSLFERHLELIADRGVLKAIPPLQWNQQIFALHQAGRAGDSDRLLKALRDLSALLAEHLPASGENPNELPDVPQFEWK